jgi:hypothetical protein
MIITKTPDNTMSNTDDDNIMTSTNNNNNNENITQSSYEQDGVVAKEIAHYLPYFPFKGIPRFYDIGGLLYEPKIFQRVVDIFIERYRGMDIDVIAGYVPKTNSSEC